MSDDRNESLNEDMSDFLAKMEFEAKHQNLDEITKNQPVPAPSTINECDTSDLYQVVYDITQYFGALGQNIPKTQMNLKMPPHIQLAKVYADHGVPGQSTMTEEDYACQTDDPIKLLPVHKTAVLTKLFGVTTEHPTVFEELQSYLSSVEVALKPTMDFFNQIAMAMRTTNMIDPNGFNLPTVPSVTMPVSVFKLKQAFDPNGLVSIDKVPTADAVSQMTEAFQGHVAQLKSSGLSNKFAETVSVFLNANPESLALRLEAMAENGTSKLSQMLTEAVNNIHETMGRAYSVTIIQRKMHELLEGINEYGSLVTRLRTEVQGKPYPVAVTAGNNGLLGQFGHLIIGAIISTLISMMVALIARVVMLIVARKASKKAGGMFSDLVSAVKRPVKGRDGKYVIDPPGNIGFSAYNSTGVEKIYKKIGDNYPKATENLAKYLNAHAEMMRNIDIREILAGKDDKKYTVTQMKFHNEISKCLSILSPDYVEHAYNAAEFYQTILTPGRSIIPSMIDHALKQPSNKINIHLFGLCQLVCSKHFTLSDNRKMFDDAANAMGDATEYALNLTSWLDTMVRTIPELVELTPTSDEAVYTKLIRPRPRFESSLYSKLPKPTEAILEKTKLFFDAVESKKPMQNSASGLMGKLNLNFSQDSNDYPISAHDISASFLFREMSSNSKMSDSEVKLVLSDAKKKHHFNVVDLHKRIEEASDIVDSNAGNKKLGVHINELQGYIYRLDKSKKALDADLDLIISKHDASTDPAEMMLRDLAISLKNAIVNSIMVVREITSSTGRYLALDVNIVRNVRFLREIPTAQLRISGALAEYADAIRDGG